MNVTELNKFAEITNKSVNVLNNFAAITNNTLHNIRNDVSDNFRSVRNELECQKNEITELHSDLVKCLEHITQLKNEVKDLTETADILTDKFNYLSSECKFESNCAWYQAALTMIIINIAGFTAHYIACHV
jgi:uncharacterized coiled-coil DUF342 family protein